MINAKSIFQNIGANSIMAAIIMLFKLISIPIFIKYWGVEFYGEWIVLTTLVAYFQMADVGFNSATANEYSFSFVKKDYLKCNILLNNNIFFILIVFAIILFILIFLIKIKMFTKMFNFNLIDSETVNLGLILLFLQVFVGTLNNLLNTIYRAINKYARGLMIDNAIRLIEYLVILIGVITNQTILIILFVVFISKIMGLFYKYFDSIKQFRFSVNFKYFRYSDLKNIVIPAFSFLSFPIANSIIFQGYILLINLFLGSVSVVIFNTMRTLTNFIRSFIDILHNSMWPEFTLAYGRNDYISMQKMHRYTLLVSLSIALLMSIFLMLFGHHIFLLWTQNKIPFDKILFFLFILTLITSSIWTSSGIVLQSTNNHKIFSLIYLISAIVSIGIVFLIISTTHVVSYIPLSLLIIDLAMIYFVINKSFKITQDSYVYFYQNTIKDLSRLILSFKTKRG